MPYKFNILETLWEPPEGQWSCRQPVTAHSLGMCQRLKHIKVTHLNFSCVMQYPSSASGPVQYGILKLGLSQIRDGYLFVPGSYNPSTANAMIVVLHAAGKGGLDALGVLIDQANSSGGPKQECFHQLTSRP